MLSFTRFRHYFRHYAADYAIRRCCRHAMLCHTLYAFAASLIALTPLFAKRYVIFAMLLPPCYYYA